MFDLLRSSARWPSLATAFASDLMGRIWGDNSAWQEYIMVMRNGAHIT
jgi:hypothetical protein